MKNDLIRDVWNIADALMVHFLDIRDSAFFSLKLFITHRHLVDYTFVNRSENISIFSPIGSSRIQKYLLSILIFMEIQSYLIKG